MRFMLLIKADPNSEAALLPAFRRYNEALIKAGVLLAAEGLPASAQGARVQFAQGATVVTEGPFSEPHELVAGFWLLQVKSRAEAIEWAKRCLEIHVAGAALAGVQVEVRACSS